MSELNPENAQTIVKTALAFAREKKMKPLAVAVLDARGALKAFAAEDGTSLKRAAIAEGKAYGAVALGVASRSIGKMAKERPQFIAAATHVVEKLIPVAGGVLIKDEAGKIIGAVGVSGDTSDNDEAVALIGIAAAKLVGDPGSD